ncbi:pirin family protein [Diaphorobacter aerolatus]|uniref:pirin family protein n=1 Tax=Diaphorobacter aerolatus TaxID=1288495 RepID=UPI001D019690|nr:pirin family protein [Diaphorobacter aerolatus]
MDFARRDGWNMYHGDTVPGFPAHPHRGFETVTIVRKGLVDHADSLGATARYGEGDVQWLTTGAGVQHGEMFPMVHEDKGNTLDLFQLWLNLPAKNKMADPDFTMFWANDIPHVVSTDANGRRSEVEVVAGDYAPVDGTADKGVTKALRPPKASWASEPNADVAIWIVTMEPGASLTLPAAVAGLNRAIYLTTGKTLTVGDNRFDQRVMLTLQSDQPVPLKNEGSETIEVLLLQGRPIGEPVVARGPFVLTTEQDLMKAMHDFQRTEFGGWPWPTRAHTHGKEKRFARHPDGRVETPTE